MSDETVQFCPRECGSLAEQERAPHCRACRGLWISQERMQRLLGMKINGQRVASLAIDNPEPLLCPEDAEEMLRFVWKGVELDYCPCCDGLWLDGGELEHIRHPVVEPVLQMASQQAAAPETAETGRVVLDLAVHAVELGLEHGKDLADVVDVGDLAEGLASLLSGLGG